MKAVFAGKIPGGLKMALAMKLTDTSGTDTLTDADLNANVLTQLDQQSGVLYLSVFQDDSDGEIGISLEAETEQEALNAETLGPYADWNAATMSAYALKLYVEETYRNIEVHAPDVNEKMDFLPNMVKAWTVSLTDGTRRNASRN